MNHFFGLRWSVFPWGCLGFLPVSALVWVASGSWIQGELPPETRDKLPPPAGRVVQFEQEVRPMLENHCQQCHARGKAKGGFSLESRDKLLRGGDTGPAVIPGNSAKSFLIELVSGLNPDAVMPAKGKRLTSEQVGILRAWIDQGAPWGSKTSLVRPSPKNLLFDSALAIRLTNSTDRLNPIDPVIKDYFERTGFTPPPAIADRAYVRRVYLDAIGLLPTPQQVETFVNDPSPGKRVLLVESLLQDQTAYAEHWLSFWNDLLRNDYAGTGFIDEGRKQISNWLYEALWRNEPFDQFVRELLVPGESSEGFLKGIVWRGVVNASQSIPMQAAQGVSQVFLGINLKCASCHDSFVSDWALADAYGMAGIFAENELEMVQCDKPLGRLAPIRFLYPELGRFDPGLGRPERLKRLAEIMTSTKNGRLAMTLVNRLWEKSMGRGLVEPVDDLEQPAWDAHLLQALALDLVQHGYDLKRTLTVILTSQAYQLPSVEKVVNQGSAYRFEGPLARRLTAEQFRDAVQVLTGRGGDLPGASDTLPADLAFLDELRRKQTQPRWIWSDDPEAERVFFRKEFSLPQMPRQASAVITASQSYVLYVNGKEAASSGEYHKLKLIDLLPFLKAGNNVMAVSAHRGKRPAAPQEGSGEIAALAGSPRVESEMPPSGLVCYARVTWGGPGSKNTAIDIPSDRSWTCITREIEGWTSDLLVTDEDRAAHEYGYYSHPEWKLANKLERAFSAIPRQNRFRASLMKNDPLQTALGRPNREQIVTVRNSPASTLQMLELTNGKILSELLADGGTHWLEKAENSPEILTGIFQAALAREPNSAERSAGLELLGDKPDAHQVSDLLWGVVMLPEFQYLP